MPRKLQLFEQSDMELWPFARRLVPWAPEVFLFLAKLQTDRGEALIIGFEFKKALYLFDSEVLQNALSRMLLK